MFINLAAALVAIGVIFAVWVGVHLIARGRMGERKFGCRGPVPDGKGNALCCKGDGTLCEHDEKAHGHLPPAR